MYRITQPGLRLRGIGDANSDIAFGETGAEGTALG